MIAVWWIGRGPRDDAALEQVRGFVQTLFGHPARVELRAGAPEEVFDPRRRQWSSSRLVSWLAGQVPSDAERVLGIFDQDLFIPVLSWVFGEAQLGGRVAVVSTARLSEHPGESAHPRTLFLSRLVKESAHELGHTLGLVHCTDVTCLMSRSPTLLHVDAKSAEICSRCRRRLQRTLEHGVTS